MKQWTDKLRTRTGVEVSVGFVLSVVMLYIGMMLGSGQLHLYFFSNNPNHLPPQLNFTSVNQVYNLLKSEFDGKLNSTQLVEGLKTGLANATGDPYTEYFSPQQAKQLTDAINGSFSGIGAELGKDANNHLVVIAPLAGTPAANAGLQPKDVIAVINGKDTTNMTIDGAVSQIRGAKGTTVTLTIIRGTNPPMTLTITRDDITPPSVKAQVINSNIGYLQVYQFNSETAALVDQAVKTFTDAHVTSIILDLRDNPGGLVDSAVHVSSLWLPSGKVVLQEKRGSTVTQTYTSSGNDPLQGIPTVVLINAGSASAAEITAGALRDNNAAYIIGTNSFGKGSVQQLNPLNDGSELKVTIAHWYRPNGQNIDHKGITPDKMIPITDDQAKAGQDPQKDAAINYLTTPH